MSDGKITAGVSNDTHLLRVHSMVAAHSVFAHDVNTAAPFTVDASLEYRKHVNGNFEFGMRRVFLRSRPSDSPMTIGAIGLSMPPWSQTNRKQKV